MEKLENLLCSYICLLPLHGYTLLLLYHNWKGMRRITFPECQQGAESQGPSRRQIQSTANFNLISQCSVMNFAIQSTNESSWTDCQSSPRPVGPVHVVLTFGEPEAPMLDWAVVSLCLFSLWIDRTPLYLYPLPP
jgi:hypothetical protein